MQVSNTFIHMEKQGNHSIDIISSRLLTKSHQIIVPHQIGFYPDVRNSPASMIFQKTKLRIRSQETDWLTGVFISKRGLTDAVS